MKVLRGVQKGKEKYFLLLKGKDSVAERTLREKGFEEIMVDRAVLLKVIASYFILLAGLLLFLKGNSKKMETPNLKREITERQTPNFVSLSLEEIKKISLREGATSAELQRAYRSVRKLLKECPDRCEMREELVRLEGALSFRIDERWRNLRFEAEKAFREGDLSSAQEKWREILILIQDESDERYAYALKRLREKK